MAARTCLGGTLRSAAAWCSACTSLVTSLLSPAVVNDFSRAHQLSRLQTSRHILATLLAADAAATVELLPDVLHFVTNAVRLKSYSKVSHTLAAHMQPAPLLKRIGEGCMALEARVAVRPLL